MRTLLPLILLGVLLSGCNGPASGDYHIERILTLSPGRVAEVNLVLEEGDHFEATFNATAALYWDIHSHPGGRLVTHEQGHAAAGNLTFTAPAGETYSIMWENDKSVSPVEVHYVVDGTGRIHSLDPEGEEV